MLAAPAATWATKSSEQPAGERRAARFVFGNGDQSDHDAGGEREDRVDDAQADQEAGGGGKIVAHAFGKV